MIATRKRFNDLFTMVYHEDGIGLEFCQIRRFGFVLIEFLRMVDCRVSIIQ